MTAVLSVAVKVVTETVSEVAVAGIVKAVTVGAVRSSFEVPKLVSTVNVVLTPLETFLAASLAQAYKFFDPLLLNVYEAGAVEDQELDDDFGVEEFVVSMYPVTPTLSVATKLVTGTIKVETVDGTEKEETIGLVLSELPLEPPPPPPPEELVEETGA